MPSTARDKRYKKLVQEGSGVPRTSEEKKQAAVFRTFVSQRDKERVLVERKKK